MGEIFSLLIRLAHFLRSFTIKSPCFVMQLRPLFPLFIALCKPRLELCLCKKMILSRIVMIFAKGGFFQKVRLVWERPLMTSDDYRRFWPTYLPFSTLKRPIFWVIFNPPTYPKIGRHWWTFPNHDLILSRMNIMASPFQSWPQKQMVKKTV